MAVRDTGKGQRGHRQTPSIIAGEAPVPLRRTGRRLNDAIYDQLRDRLLDGHYSAGARLPIEDLRAEFGVSKQPVMEALRRLSADGMVEIVPQVGSLVATYDLRQIKDFYLMFGGFEGCVAGIAAERRTPGQLAELDLISRRIDALRTERDPVTRSRGYRQWNRAFHGAIGAMAQSRVIAETSRRMWDLSDFLINATGVPQPLSSALDDRDADHESIRAALHLAGRHGLRARRPRRRPHRVDLRRHHELRRVLLLRQAGPQHGRRQGGHA